MANQMTTLEKLSKFIASMSPHHKFREGGRLLIEAEDEIERLENKVSKQRSALEQICEVSQREGYTNEDRANCSKRIASGALSK